MATAHASALIARHAGIDTRLAEETRRPMPDTRLIAELKKQKLRLKELISRD